MAYSNFDRLNRRVQLDPEDHLQRLRALNARARIKGSGVFLEVLADRRVWNKTPRTIQDMAIQEVGRRCHGLLTYLKTEVYSCGGQRHRIASFTDKKTGLVLNLIPGGKYMRGSISSEADGEEQPVKEVTIPAFFVGQTQVTQEAWDQVGGEDNRRWGAARLPIECCSWKACDNWLRKAGGGLRMLSESEWEYACRAGTTTRYYFGDNPDDLGIYAWFDEHWLDGGTHPVGEKWPNAFGLYDMHGNVSEWCADWWASYSEVAATHEPHSKPASDLMIRGGNYCTSALGCRSAYRGLAKPAYHGFELGLRVARSLN